MYNEMFKYVEKILTDGQGRKSRNVLQTFRDRFDHIRRVYMWAEKLLPDFPNVNEKVVRTATIFHDVGYAGIGYKKDHHKKSAKIFRDYAKDQNFSDEFTSSVVFCILNHCDKTNLQSPIATDELKLLIEADLLDEEGAMGIAFDLLVTGATFPRNYVQGYEMILNHTAHIYDQDYMITPIAKALWDDKRALVKNFMEALKIDLEMAEYE